MCHETLNCILICCLAKKFRNTAELSGKYKYEDGIALTGMMHAPSFRKIHQLMEKLSQEDTQI
jgi:hypothetical protein